MREQIEGSRAIAITVARCRPQVVPAYPITPQTHIVEALGTMVKSGQLPGCDYLTVESEFAAMSAAIGSAAVGVRSYTATASQGLLYMAEALYNASGLGMPIVMTVANRAIGAPINIWNDQSDSLSQRDCGWVQLYAADNQTAVDLHPIAFAIAEQTSVPVMVCVDGFVLTHAFEPIDVPDAETIDAFLPVVDPRQRLDPDEPVTIGAMVGPDAYTEVRVLADLHLRSAEPAFTQAATRYGELTGRTPQLVRTYGSPSARTAVITLGSVTGTVTDVIDVPASSARVVELTMYRPFPAEAVRDAVAGADHVIVLERALTPGSEGAVTCDVRAALVGLPIRVSTVVAGLGGRAVTRDSVRRMLDDDRSGTLPPRSVMDVRTGIVEREAQHR